MSLLTEEFEVHPLLLSKPRRHHVTLAPLPTLRQFGHERALHWCSFLNALRASSDPAPIVLTLTVHPVLLAAMCHDQWKWNGEQKCIVLMAFSTQQRAHHRGHWSGDALQP